MKSIHTPECRVLLGWLRTERRQAGLTMRAVARRLGVPHSWIGKVETGERRLDVSEFVRLCKVLDVDPHTGIDVVRAVNAYPPHSVVAPAAAEPRGKYGRKRKVGR